MIKKLKTILKNILKSHSSNLDIALGFGLGIFVGFIPVYGFQTILVLLLLLFIPKCNKITAIASSQLFIPPFIPFTVGLDFIVGSLLLTGKINLIRITQFEDILIYIKPIFIGSIIVAPIMGALSTLIVYLILKKTRHIVGARRAVPINNKK